MCGAILKIADDAGVAYCTIVCTDKTPHVTHTSSFNHILGNYSIAWDFDEKYDWECEPVPLWGRHADGTPRTQDEYDSLKNEIDAEDCPQENDDTEEE